MKRVIGRSAFFLAAAVLVTACTSTGSSSNGWTYPALTEVQRQQELDKCRQQAAAAEADYYRANARGDANSASPFINNLKVRQRSQVARTAAWESCLLAAGFTRQP